MVTKKKVIELLAPAKNKKVGIAAITHGADAVYIGASRYGARFAAGYGARVYVTVNTLVADHELEDCYRLIDELQNIGVDALLLQDMALLKFAYGKLELHASTQTDIREINKAQWLNSLGFSRLVLARELSLEDIKNIHTAMPDVELEAFVHGALCVCYSGQCFASEYCFGRSANRGECSQMCRMSYNMLDANNKLMVANKHLLSLKDMCRLDHLEQLIDAGVTSFKIEGRLKDESYVKNVVAAYNIRLNEVIKRNSATLTRLSFGKCEYNFLPDVRKTFNRGYTTYFLNKREINIFQPNTPKSLGECVGRVKECRGNYIVVAGTASFANGDGLCFINTKRQLEGFRVNRAYNNKIYPLKMPTSIKVGDMLFRNHDKLFNQQLSLDNSSVRKIPVSMYLSVSDKELPEGGDFISLQLTLQVYEKPSLSVAIERTYKREIASTHQIDNIAKQLNKLGNTNMMLITLDIDDMLNNYFIPSSQIATLRREAVNMLEEKIVSETRKLAKRSIPTWHIDYNLQSKQQQYPYLLNIYNEIAEKFYIAHNVSNANKNCLVSEGKYPLLMQCKHCLKYSLGLCKNHEYDKGNINFDLLHEDRCREFKEPFMLQLENGKRFKLEFDCKQCQMNIYAQD